MATKRILGLDLGTNSIGWALVEHDFNKKTGEIEGLGSRIIPMSQDILGNFEAGQSHSQTADRTHYRSVRRLYQRNKLRRERLHRALNIIGFLPKHYANEIDFEKHFGQFKKGNEPKLNYRPLEPKNNGKAKFEFVFQDSFKEMVAEMKQHQPQLFFTKKNGEEAKIPFDWTIYYLRKKALSKKISKEELAWIILNFNQKRGYYQLRGEDEETDESKREEFHALKVVDVEETDDSNARGIWYNIKLENGWVYRRQSKEPLPWRGKIKEFVVTTQLNKDGTAKLDSEDNPKRSFRAVDSDKDWIAIKKKTEQKIERANEHIGEYIFDNLLQKPFQKIRGKLIKTIERKYYKRELIAILQEQQKYHDELQDRELYLKCLNELYPRNEAHVNNVKDEKDPFSYLFVNDIIFYQRPLRSKKSSIADCQYEKRSYLYKNEETGVSEKRVAPLKGIPKSHPLFQEFRLWQFLRNLAIYEKEQKIEGETALNVDVTEHVLPNEGAWVELFDFLQTKKEIEQHHILKYFSDKKLIPKQNKEKSNFRWNYPEDKKYPMGDTRASFLSRLKKVEGLNPDKFLTADIEYHLWHIIYSVTDKIEFETALGTFANKYGIDQVSFVDAFKKFPPFDSQYGAYSEKALQKILPLMRLGKYWDESAIADETKQRVESIIERLKTIEFDKERIDENVVDDDIPARLLKSFIPFKGKNPLKGLNTYQACYAVYNRHSEAAVNTKWKSPEDIDNYLNEFKQHSLRNPIVEQVMTETLRVVRDIWKYYGKGAEKYLREIHVELGREMKNPKDKRERMAQNQKANENTNQRIREILTELASDNSIDAKPYSPSHQEILKIYEEGVYENSPENYKSIELAEIEKIRKKPSPSKKEIQKYRLWLEQGYKSPYTGATIPLSSLFTSEYQIEHIIPQSRLFDDSLSNKVICESAVNEDKDNQTAFEYIKNNPGKLINLSQGKSVRLYDLESFEANCKKYFANSRTKLKKLLSEDVPDGFIERQLNDSRYISKLVKGLMSNIVKEDSEIDAISKNVVTITGSITSQLKNDWGLNDKWNDLILPRFERMNQLTQSEDFTSKNTQGITIPTVPKDLAKGFSKKRIDHRHHALDALVVACCTKDHVNYITSLNTNRHNHSLVKKLRNQKEVERIGRKRIVAKEYKLPWEGFPVDAKNSLETTVVSFKNNLRVINKANNKTWQWVKENGQLKKKLVKQTKGDNWAIRKSLHKETVSGKINIKAPKGKIATATRVSLSDLKNTKHLEKVADKQIREVILPNHLKNYLNEKGDPDFERAFDQDGIDELNANIKKLNEGKNHQPIHKVPVYEIGSKFSISEDPNSPKNKKYVEAAKGTNLYFAIYRTKNKKGERVRQYETVPLNEVVEHQKQVADLPKKERTPIPLNPEKGEFLFALSPEDLVYVPTNEEIDNPSLVDFKVLSKEQVSRVYKMVSTTQDKLECVPCHYASPIKANEIGSNNKSQNMTDGVTQIKSRCWKLKVDRLGNITQIINHLGQIVKVGE